MTGATVALKVLDERIRPYLPAYATPGSAGMDSPLNTPDRDPDFERGRQR